MIDGGCALGNGASRRYMACTKQIFSRPLNLYNWVFSSAKRKYSHLNASCCLCARGDTGPAEASSGSERGNHSEAKCMRVRRNNDGHSQRQETGYKVPSAKRDRRMKCELTPERAAHSDPCQAIAYRFFRAFARKSIAFPFSTISSSASINLSVTDERHPVNWIALTISRRERKIVKIHLIISFQK